MKNDTHSIPNYSYPYKVIDGCLYREKIDKYGAHDQKLCNFLILFLGRTGTGKSTLSSLFLSFFGHFTPSDLPISFRDTKNSINQCCAMLNDVLTCVDDFHPSGRKEEQELMEKAQMLARAYGDRVGRGRLRAEMSSAPVKSAATAASPKLSRGSV